MRDWGKETRTLERMHDRREPEAVGCSLRFLAVKAGGGVSSPTSDPLTKDSTGCFLSWAASWPVGNVKGGPPDCGRIGLWKCIPCGPEGSCCPSHPRQPPGSPWCPYLGSCFHLLSLFQLPSAARPAPLLLFALAQLGVLPETKGK